MATTTNYGWDTPDDTDLVKDGAAAIRTLGSSIDTTTKNLNPETTTGDIAYRSATANVNTRLPIGSAGQVLTVAAGVPSWANPSDQTPLTTKGDVFTFSTVDARLGVGANGTVLTADSSEATGLKWAAPASGGMTLISTTTMSGASVTLSSIPQDYVSLLLVGRFFTNSTADGVLRINPNGDGGIARISGVIASGTFSSTTNILQLPASYDRTNNDNSFQLQIFNYQDTDNYTMPFMWSGNFYAGAVGLMAGGILTANAGPITSLVISNTGGNWAGGTLKFYGVK